MNSKLDVYFSQAEKWPTEMSELRRIFLDCQLSETLKWNKPCYTSENKNIVLIMGLKEYCAVLFFKGGLLKDPHHVLVKPGENTEVGRQMRFTSVQEILQKESILKAYIDEAIAIEKAGLKIEPKPKNELKIPEELNNKFIKFPKFKLAFDALTPGRQRAYIFHFSGAKQSKTREARIEKWMPQILKGKGLND
jgi:uncharacterized protein YdeI (YjbR/CyaY-like superfamily)